MEYVRSIDFAAFAASPAEQRVTQRLLALDSGATNCTINVIKVPPGGGSPEGKHTHVVDQIFYVVSGVMSVEVDGQVVEAGPGSMVFLPPNVAHRNWNSGTDTLIHLGIQAPVPQPGEPFSVPSAE